MGRRGGLAAGTIYNPGWLPAIFLFLTPTAWMVHALFGEGGFRYRALACVIGWGVVLHLILAASIVALMRGMVSALGPTLLVQAINAGLLVLGPSLVERWCGAARTRGRAVG